MAVVKKKRLKKSVKITLALFLILLVAGTLGFLNKSSIITDVTGFFTLDDEPPAPDPNMVSFFINYTEKPRQLRDGVWTLYQRYRLDQPLSHQYCEIDCANTCEEKDLDYVKGYVQQWGKCKCKCTISEAAEVLEDSGSSEESEASESTNSSE